ncbi:MULTISPECIES: FeoC-like transcriptional regulator [unclassified Mameliella]
MPQGEIDKLLRQVTGQGKARSLRPKVCRSLSCHRCAPSHHDR